MKNCSNVRQQENSVLSPLLTVFLSVLMLLFPYMFGWSQCLNGTQSCPEWHHNAEIREVEQSKDVTGENLLQSCLSVFNMTDSCWHVEPILSSGKIWNQLIPFTNRFKRATNCLRLHDAAYLDKHLMTWTRSGKNRLRFVTEINIRVRMSTFEASQEAECVCAGSLVFQKSTPPHPYPPPTINSSKNTAAYMVTTQWREWLISWRRADTAQVSVCALSHRGWRLKTWIYCLLQWRTFISGLFFCLSLSQKKVSVLVVFFCFFFF